MGSLPTLYTRDRNGTIRFWQVKTEGNEIVVAHGVLGGASTIQRRKATPKNVGRSNATTAEQQAVLEAQAEHKHKLDRKYSLTPEDAQEIVRLPMLAKVWAKVKKKTFPVRIQRKLNGLRARATREDGKVVLYSRQGKVWDKIPHINAAVEKLLPPDSEFDGELYIHGVPLQTLNSATKNADNPYHLKLQYHVYDMPIVNGREDLPWLEREDALIDVFFSHKDWFTILPVPGLDAQDDAEVKALHDKFVGEGYEGAIARFNEVYEWGHRSSSLLKVKEFDDAEFEIVGFTQGEGTEEGLVLWQCITKEGRQFTVRPMGSHSDRAKLFGIGQDYVGQKLKVRHFGWTEDNIPFHPHGEAIRLPEDL